MSILAAYCVPHPPIILPEIGRGEEGKIRRTTEALSRIAKEIAQLKPDTIILITPHMVMYQDYFHIAPGKTAHGDLTQFGAPEVSLHASYDEELIQKLSLHLAQESFPAGTQGVQNATFDHATVVPLYFIQKEYQDFNLLRIGLSGFDLVTHYQLGMHIQQVVEDLGRHCIIVASGDLSHRLKEDGPYGFNPKGPIYDQAIMAALSSGDFKEILAMDSELYEAAGECGHRSFAIMAGCLDRKSIQSEAYSYEGPFGVGYGTVAIKVSGHDSNRDFLDQYLKTSEEKSESKRETASPLVRLALATIVAKLKGERFNLKEYLKTNSLPDTFLANQAGTFVTLKKNGQLRGCIGTIAPTTDTVVDEVVRNAIEAAFYDPRFPSLSQEEFLQIDCSVDVLAPAETIHSVDQLNPKQYGVIVTKGPRRGLLLPNLVGVDTVEEQLKIAKSKAGIGPDEDCELERFKVVRYV